MCKSIFEKIINNEISSYKIYENNEFIAILDINPVSPGHTLLIPKIKKRNILLDTDEINSSILLISQKIANRIKNNLNASGFKFIFNNELSSGQVVFHTHMHIIPYYDNKDNDKFIIEEIYNKLK